jgi:hypothetical protein
MGNNAPAYEHAVKLDVSKSVEKYKELLPQMARKVFFLFIF